MHQPIEGFFDVRRREALRVGGDAPFVLARLDHDRGVAERGGREVADLFRERFRRSDEPRAELDEHFADAVGIATDGGEVECIHRELSEVERRKSSTLRELLSAE